MADSVRKLMSTFKNLHANPWLEEFLCLGILDCNADELANFSTDLKLKLELLTWENEDEERFYFATSLGEIFTKTLSELAHIIEIENYKSPYNLKLAIDRLENFRSDLSGDGHHLKCLKKLKKRSECETEELKKKSEQETEETKKEPEHGTEDTKKLCEAEILAVLACHLFSPLLAEGDVILDRTCCKTNVKAECPFCKTEVKTGNTNFGCRELWHGRADMVIKSKNVKSIVKVAVSEEEGQGEPATKKAKFEDLEDGVENMSSTFMEVKKSASKLQVINEEDCKIKEKERKVIKPDKSFNQAICQTIVNAFLVVKENKNLENYLIPSFFVTDNFISINFYSAKQDVLLSQISPFEIFDNPNLIKISTVVSIWLALNFEWCPGDCSYVVKDYYGKYVARSGFKDFLVKNEVLEKYEKDVEFGFSAAKKLKCKEVTKPNTVNFPQRLTKLVNLLYEGTDKLS